MKRFTTSLILACGLLSSAFIISYTLPIGAKAPSPEKPLKDVSGKMTSMQKLVKENGLLVMFSANTCPYVLGYQQRTLAVCDLAQKLKIGVILVNSNEAQRDSEDSYDNMRNYSADQKYNWNYVVDSNSEMADAFGAMRTPECFLFNKDLELKYHGSIDDNPSDANAVSKNYLKEALKQLSSGKEITTKETRGVGCAIKRIKK